MRGYGYIQEDFPERIMRMAEVNVHGRHELLKSSVATENTSTLVFSWTISVVSILGLVGGFTLILLGFDPLVLVSWVPALFQGVAAAINSMRGRSDPPSNDEEE